MGNVLKLALISVVWENTLLSEGLCVEDHGDLCSHSVVGAVGQVCPTGREGRGGSSGNSLSFGCRKRQWNKTSGINHGEDFPHVTSGA